MALDKCPYCGEPDCYEKWTEQVKETGNDYDDFANLIDVEMEDCRNCDCQPLEANV